MINNLDEWNLPNFTNSDVKVISTYYFQEVNKSDTKLANKSINALINYYDTLTKEEWYKIFNNLNGDDFKRLEIIEYSNWNSYSLEALKDKLLSIAKTGKIENKDKISLLIKSFENDNKDLSNTFKNIRDEFINSRNINTELFTFFGSWLFKYALLEDKSGDTMRTIIIVDLLDDDECLELIIQNKDTIKRLIKDSSLSEVSDFKEGIRDRWKIRE